MSNGDPNLPWYREGLQFECTRCGRCCTGGPGIVQVNADEVTAMASFLEMPREQFLGHKTRMTERGLSLKEQNNYDCIFWDRKTGCTIYAVRPAQCRTWPFWASNVRTPADWARTCKACPGCGDGPVHSGEEISRLIQIVKI